MNWFQPGAGVSVAGTATADVAAMATRQQSVTEIFLHLFPTSIFDAMARGDILQVVVFASFFGVALAGIGEKGRPVLEFLESVAQVMFKFTAYVMKFAPIGVMAAMAATVGGRGLGILLTLGKLVGVMYLGLFIFLFIVIGGVALLIRVPFFTFLRAIREPFLIAFTTASSEAALPKALEVMARFGVPRNIVGFVLPDRLQLQPRWHDAVSLDRERVRRAVGRAADVPGPAVDDDADPDADQQGRRGRASRRARRPDGGARHVRPAARRRGHPARHRSDSRHGTDRRERHGQLPGHRGRGALGRRARRPADREIPMKLLVVGAAGQLGSTFAGTPGHDVVGLTRADVDVTDQDALLAVVERIRPDVLVNCTAYNNVDGAEDDASTALAVNAIAVRSMAAAAARAGATFVHYSTDFVFDGEASSPYAEEDRARPVSVYGCSKLLGEWFARDAPRWYVLRVESLFGGRQARSSVDKIAAALRDGRSTPVFADRVVTPSYVDDVRDATLALLARDTPSGVFHCVNSGQGTWADVGRHIAGLLGADPALLVLTSVNDVTLKAKRPVYCALDNRKLTEAVGWPLPTWQDAVSRYVTTL